VNCYMHDSTGGVVAAVAICHHCGVGLCREHLDEDLLAPRAHGHTRKSCTHHPHGAAVRRQARPQVGASPVIDQDRPASVGGNTDRLQPRELRRLLCGRLRAKVAMCRLVGRVTW